MKRILRSIAFGLFFLESLTAKSDVVFYENEERVLTCITMEGCLPDGKSWMAVPFYTRTESDTGLLRGMYADPETMCYWLDGSTFEGNQFANEMGNLDQRSSVRFGAGNPHGVLLVRNDGGECIGHAVIGQHFGHKCIGVSAFFFTPKAWQDGYPQAVADAYFTKWVPEVVKRDFTCFTGSKASDDWGSDGRLRYLMMLVHPDKVLEVSMMGENGFGPLGSWENQDVQNVSDPFNSPPEQEVANNLIKFWDDNGLLDNRFYNVSINGVVRSVMKLIFGFRYGFWRDAVPPEAVAKKVEKNLSE